MDKLMKFKEDENGEIKLFIKPTNDLELQYSFCDIKNYYIEFRKKEWKKLKQSKPSCHKRRLEKI